MIVLSAIPIAILVNAFRVALTGILTHHFGEKAAEGVIHQTEGLFTFGLALPAAAGRGVAARRLCAGAPRRRARPRESRA